MITRYRLLRMNCWTPLYVHVARGRGLTPATPTRWSNMALYRVGRYRGLLSSFQRVMIREGLHTSSTVQYEYIKVDKRGEKSKWNYKIIIFILLYLDNVGLIQLNRLKALNALCDGLVSELGEALKEMENDTSIDAIVITGTVNTQHSTGWSVMVSSSRQ